MGRGSGGKRYEVSTRCTRLAPALEQWAAFQADPEGYNPAAPKGEALQLTAELVRAFLAFSSGMEREGRKGHSRPWVLQQQVYLAWWGEKLWGRDLRALNLGTHVIPMLDGMPGENDPRFLPRVESARASLRQGRGLRLEDL
jgi:hypothetical protein